MIVVVPSGARPRAEPVSVSPKYSDGTVRFVPEKPIGPKRIKLKAEAPP
jgi:hypothetical protein